MAAQVTEEEKYQHCEPFKFICPLETCGTENVMTSVFTSATADLSVGRVSVEPVGLAFVCFLPILPKFCRILNKIKVAQMRSLRYHDYSSILHYYGIYKNM